MNLDRHLKLLAGKARRAGAPETDVSHRVINLLRVHKTEPVYRLERPMMWMAGLSSAIAVSTVVIALLLHFGVSADPLSEVLETVSWASLQ